MDEQNQIGNLTPNVDTRGWNLPTPETLRAPEVGNTPMQFASPTQTVADYTPAVMGMVNSVRFDALNNVSKKSNTNSTLDKIFPNANKLDLTTDVSLFDTHELLNDGETWIPKYESYVPGVDNEARLAAQQSSFEKFINPIYRFNSNVAKAPLDIASFVYGIGDAAISGRFDALYDNEFSRFTDDLTSKTNAKYKNYYDESQKNLGNLGYLWDKFGSGAEFTARMLASEAIIAVATGGTSVPASMARLGLKGALYANRGREALNVLSTGNKISRMLRIATQPERAVAMQGDNVASTFARMTGALETASKRGAMGDRLVQLRFATTSPMYEAGFEAMHFQKEAEQSFWDYHREHGTEPTTEELNKFSAKMNGAASWVFGLNMGILSVSNLAMFGDLLNIKNPLAKLGTQNAVKSNVFRIGTETGENGLKQAMKAGFWNKTAAYASPFAKGALIEGVYEEGSQGIASSTFKNYVASSYNKELMTQTGDYASAFSKAFSDQFSSKEGMEEIAIGALVGGLFGGVGGAVRTNREYKQQGAIADLQNKGQAFVNEFNTNAYTNEQLLSLFSHANRFQDLQTKMGRAEEAGNKFEQARLSSESFISLLNSYHTVGKESEFTNMWASMMRGMNNETIAESTGMSLDQVDAFKVEQIKNMNEFAENYKQGREAAQHMFKPNIGGFTEIENADGTKTKVNSSNMIDAFSYAYGMSFFNEKFATETFDAFQTKLSQTTNNSELVSKMGALAALQMADDISVARYNDLDTQYREAVQEMETATDQLNTIQRGEDKQAVAEKVFNKSKEIQSIQNKISEIANNRTLLWKSLIDNFYTKMGKAGHATEMQLNSFTNQVSEIQSALENSPINKADRLVMNQLLDQFSEANESYKSYSNLVNRLGDPAFAYKTYRGLFSGVRAKLDKSINEHTMDVLMDIYNYGRVEPTEATETVSVDTNTNAVDPISDTSDLTRIDSNKVKLRTKQKQLDDLMAGIYSDTVQNKIDKIREDEAIAAEERQSKVKEIQQLNDEIQELEFEIQQLEESKKINEERRNAAKETKSYNYKQYEYTKRNGTVVTGWIEFRNNKTFFVTNDESIYLGQQDIVILSSVKGLKEISEEDVMVEGNEVYVNGKLYKLKNFNKDITTDANGNYEVTLTARNGRPVIMKGEIADVIVYQYTLNEFLEQATDEQIRELSEQAKADRILEEKYEELISKTEDRDSKESEVAEAVSNTVEVNTSPELIQRLKDYWTNVYFRDRTADWSNLGFGLFATGQKLIPESLYNKYFGHGMGKSGVSSMMSDFITLFSNGIDVNQGNLGGLYTAPMEGAGQAGAAIGATDPYHTGAFIIVSTNPLITDINQVSAVLINDGLVEEFPEILSLMSEFLPNMRFAKFSEAGTIIQEVENNSTESQSIQDKIDEVILDEAFNLENEIAEAQGEINAFEKKGRITDRIQELKDKLQSGEQIDPMDIKLLNKLEIELDQLNNEPTPFNPNDSYMDQLTWIINNIHSLNFENVESLNSLTVPDEADIQEYVELLEEGTNRARIAELRDKLLPYNLADGMALDGMNILDILELYNQSKRIQDINTLQRENMQEEEFQTITKNVKDIETTSEYKSANVALNYDGAYIEQKNNSQNIHHIKLGSILEKALDSGNNPEIIVYDKDGNVTTSVMITDENIDEMGELYDSVRNIKVVLADGVYMRKPLDSTSFRVYGDILPMMDLTAYAITGQPTGFNLIYDVNLDGTLSPKESEFTVTNDGNVIPFDKEVLNAIKPGDTVTLEFDRNDDYNKTLTEDEYATKGNIYVKKNGKLVNILKASDVQNKSNSENWDDLAATRRKVVKESLSNRTVEVTVNKSYIGLPIVNLNSNGRAIEVPLDKTKVVAYGYVDENGVLQGEIANRKLDNSQYIEPLYSYGYKTPVMAFEYNGKVYGFPMNVKPKTTNATVDLDNIMNDDTLNREHKILQVNNLLELHGLLTNDVALSNTNFNVTNAREALSTIAEKVDITDKVEFDNAEKTAFIDVNNPFMSAKLVLNLISAQSEIEAVKIETNVTLGNQNPNVSVTTVNAKGEEASKDKTCNP